MTHRRSRHWSSMRLFAAASLLLIARIVIAQDSDSDQFQALYDAGKYAEAQKYAERILASQSDANGRATWMHNLAMSFDGQSKYKEAEPVYRESLAILERILGKDHPNVALSLSNLGNTEMHLGKFAEAEAHHKQSLAIRERLGGPDSPEVIANLVGLAGNFQIQGRHADAEPLLMRTLKLLEKVLPQENPVWASVLSNLGANYQAQGRYRDAESVLKRAIAIREKVQGARHPEIVSTLNNLANVYQLEGNTAEAEPLYRRAISLGREVSLPDNMDLLGALQNLGTLTAQLSRHEDAAKCYTEALGICERMLGEEHPHVGAVLSGLADVERRQGRFTESERHHRRSLAIYEKALGKRSSAAAREVCNIAILANLQKRHEEAQTLREKALEIWTAIGEGDQPEIIQLFEWSGIGYLLNDEPAKALTAYDRAMALVQKYPSLVEQRSRLHRYRAEALWELGRRDEVFPELERAFDLLDQQRPQTSGTEQEQAVALDSASSVVDVAVAWNAELGRVEQAFAAIERTRARGLADQMQLQGADLLAGLPSAQASELRKRDEATRVRVASLRSQLKAVGEWNDDLGDAKKRKLAEVQGELDRAENDYVAVYRDIRAVSPLVRLAAGTGRESASLEAVQNWLSPRKALLLEYHLGDEEAFVVVIHPDGTARVVKLELNEEQARNLSVSAGALTEEKMRAVLSVDGRELSALLSTPETAETALPRLAILWTILVPEAERVRLQEGGFENLIVVPDGPLALLPFDTLIVEPGTEPKYLLDNGPPITYAPSATILLNLSNRQAKPTPPDLKPVLTVGDIMYSGTKSSSEPRQRSRYSGLGGRLAPLPHSGKESAWVAAVFSEAGLATGRLLKEQATESAVRFNVSGRKIVHLACHGLVDQSFGNLFGALALTPGSDSATNTANDGLLTLAEVYGLDLKSCELSILSACRTNFGPLQQGEGVWALSRGFLVAGSRHVVASNWLVDDEAAASLISYFCGGIARDEKSGGPTNYASRLQAAKRYVRTQEKWSSPYYWGTFVMIGTP